MATVFLKWDKAALTTNVEAMDREHEKLIGIMNRLYERHEAKANKAELQGIIEELAKWTQTHFSHEEKYFCSIPYPQAEAHKGIHADLLKKLTQHQTDFAKTGRLSDDFFKFLKMWLTAHIVGVDNKYGQIANKKVG